MFGNSSELFVNNSQGFRNSSRNFMNRSGILTETSNKEADAPPMYIVYTWHCVALTQPKLTFRARLFRGALP